jgi:hypothetical protein
MYHGLSAYNRTHSGLEVIRRADAIANGEAGTICCADTTIGPVGVFVEGKCPVAFAGDVWSKPDDSTSIGRCFTSISKTRWEWDSIQIVSEGDSTLRLMDAVWDENTERYVWETEHTYFVDASADLTDAQVEKVSAVSEQLGNTYAEFWFRETSVSAVWVSVDASPRWHKIARILARRLDVPLMRVTGKRLEWRKPVLPVEDQEDFGPYDLYEEAI